MKVGCQISYLRSVALIPWFAIPWVFDPCLVSTGSKQQIDWT